MTARRVILVSPHFPPSGMAGVHRARILANHLSDQGWEPIVVCVDEAYHEQPLDPELAKLVSANVRVVKVPAWPAGLCRPLGLGDIAIRGWFSMKREVDSLLGSGQADLLMVTVLPGFSMRLGPQMKRKYGIPFVLDYQDPWVSEWGARQRRFSKAGLAYRLAQWQEPAAIRSADQITSVSQGTNDFLRGLYPDLPADRFHAIPIGVDSRPFELLARSARPCPWLAGAPGTIHLSYIGNLWPGAGETLEAFFQGVAILKERRPDLFARLRLHFLGTSNQPDGSEGQKAVPMARRHGVESIVQEVPARLPYLDALNVMIQSTGLLLLGSNDPHYTASKLYPCLFSGRPVFALVHEASSVRDVATKTGGVLEMVYGKDRPVSRLQEDIADALVRICEQPESIPPVRREVLEPYLGPGIAAAFAAVFESALEGR